MVKEVFKKNVLTKTSTRRRLSGDAQTCRRCSALQKATGVGVTLTTGFGTALASDLMFPHVKALLAELGNDHGNEENLRILGAIKEVGTDGYLN